ncbi:MAG: sigma-70 family RNA polymerase sigma factor [Vicinamibacteria bacterium]|nr:sigma-70 family RNA polymerase sigma factor [Vicinamibacteria bacterium]
MPVARPLPEPDQVTALLDAWCRGERDALASLVPVVHAELRRMAARELRRERGDHTLQPTALVNEAFLRLAGQRQVRWQSRAHFFGVAARVMRRVLVDHARRRSASRRGAAPVRVELTEATRIADGPDLDLVALDAALDALARQDPRQARGVELRFFGGLTVEEAAEVLDVAPSTVKLDWQMARAWLLRRLEA